MNLRNLAPKVLPLRELLRYLKLLSFQRLKNYKSSIVVQDATLNFKTGVGHLVIYVGGKTTIEGIGRSLGLPKRDLQPSRMTFHKFSNKSASSIWYVLGYREPKKMLKKGNTLLMISLGSGLKYNSCLLEAIRDVDDENMYKDSIVHYPKSYPFREKYGWINDNDPTSFKP